MVGESIFSTDVDPCFLADTISVVENDDTFSLSGFSSQIVTTDGNLVGPHTIDLEAVIETGEGEHLISKSFEYEI